MISLSPGLLVGAFELLRICGDKRVPLRELPAAFSKLGGMPIKDVLALAQGVRWIEANTEGTMELTLSGQRLLNLGSYQARTRAAILDYIDIVRPAWLQAAGSGRSRVLLFAGSAIAQVFDEAGLASGTDGATVAFWDALAARARGLKDDRLTAIGRIGERASIDFEQNRTGHKPMWVALESNADGYDVLSILDRTDPRPMSIEVKATTRSNGGHFHLTQNEWRRAQETDHHVFHLWRVEDESAVYPPVVVTTAAMSEHVPANLGEGEWQSVVIPFAAFPNTT